MPRHPGVADPLYAGTFVVEGAATAVVTATGASIRLAGIAELTGRARPPRTPLAVRLDRVVRVVAVTAVTVGGAFLGLALLLGIAPLQGVLLAIGVTVALVPEGLLPTVTLALAWGARRMAARNALVRRLKAVETLGSVTYICTDKTGTLTRNQMSVVTVWTPEGSAEVRGEGYEPTGEIDATPAVRGRVADLAYAAVRASSGGSAGATAAGTRPATRWRSRCMCWRCGWGSTSPPASTPSRRRRSSHSTRGGSGTRRRRGRRCV